MARFRNYYECLCGAKWTDEGDCTRDDRCPECRTSCSPYRSQDVDDELAEERVFELENLLLTLDSTFADMETAKRKGYLARDLSLLRKEANAIRDRRAK